MGNGGSQTHRRSEAEWDAEIEADFQRTVAQEGAGGRRKRGLRLVAFPWGFLVDVCRLTEGRAAVIVAEYIYRRTHVCRSRTVTLPGAELAELGINLRLKLRALRSLEAAGLIWIEKVGPGRATSVTLQWPSP
jgi:hypothetical protein